MRFHFKVKMVPEPPVGGGGKETDMTVNISKKHLYMAIAALGVFVSLLVLLIVHLTKPAPLNPPALEVKAPPDFIPQSRPIEMKDITSKGGEYRLLVQQRLISTSKRELLEYFEDPEDAWWGHLSFVIANVIMMRDNQYMKIKLDPSEVRILERFAPEIIDHRVQRRAPLSWYEN